jgi:hypothetical protein
VPLGLTFANPMGEWLAPFLLAVRATGFFEWYVYMPLMTLLSVPLYRWLSRRLAAARDLEIVPARRGPWRVAYYAPCFLLTNVLAVAVKTMIVEEMDYPEPPWFTPLVSPLHFYIASVAGAYLWLLVRARRAPLDWALGIYVQIGLIGGYAVAVWRLRNEPFSLADPTTAVSGIVMGLAFLAYNWDLARRIALPIRSAGRTLQATST